MEQKQGMYFYRFSLNDHLNSTLFKKINNISKSKNDIEKLKMQFYSP